MAASRFSCSWLFWCEGTVRSRGETAPPQALKATATEKLIDPNSLSTQHSCEKLSGSNHSNVFKLNVPQKPLTTMTS